MALNQGWTYTLHGGIKTGVAPGQSQYSVGTGQQVKILNTKNVGGQTYYDIQHIGGGTGWTPASMLESALGLKAAAPIAKKTTATPKATVTPLTTIAQQLGQQGQTALTGYLQPLQTAYGEYAAAQERMASPIELYKQYETEAGVTERQAAVDRLRKQTASVTELLNNLEGNVQQRLSGVLTTAAQRERVVGAEAAPLSKQLGTLGGLLGVEEPALAAAQARAGTMTGYAVAGEQQKLLQYQTQIESARFTAEQQIESMRDDLTRRYGAAEAERQIAAAKAELERQIQAQKAAAAQEFQYAQALNRQEAALNPPSGGGGGGTTAKQQAQKNFLAQWNNVLSLAKKASSKYKAQDIIYQYLMKGGANQAKAAGLDPETFWAVWRAVKG